MNIRFLPILLAIACGPVALPAQAETQQCTEISALPTVITTQGVYCLKKHLATSIAAGSAIEITTNNVTIDCNGFRIGGLTAGTGTQAVGITAMQRSNITVRNCTVRGFLIGIGLDYNAGGSLPPTGQLVEDNRLDQNTFAGIIVAADGSQVRRNIVSRTGGSTLSDGYNPTGIRTHFNVDVIDNTIDEVVPSAGMPGLSTYGILAWTANGSKIARNRIRNISASGGARHGILTAFDVANATIQDNVLMVQFPGENAYGILCYGGSTVARGNTVGEFSFGISGCDGPGNFSVVF